MAHLTFKGFLEFRYFRNRLKCQVYFRMLHSKVIFYDSHTNTDFPIFNIHVIKEREMSTMAMLKYVKSLNIRARLYCVSNSCTLAETKLISSKRSLAKISDYVVFQDLSVSLTGSICSKEKILALSRSI